ncbi:putative reverse transcriptase domain-containing protein [Tanacetum coccineum]
MDVQPSPNRVYDFPMAEPEPHPAYDFFAAELIPGLAEALILHLETKPVLEQLYDAKEAELDLIFGNDTDDEDDNGEDDSNEDGWEVDDEWLMAPVTTPLMHVVPPPSTFEVGGPSTAAPGLPFPVGRPFPKVVSSVAVHHEEIGGLHVRTENLEHAHEVLVEVLASQQEQVMTMTPRKFAINILGVSVWSWPSLIPTTIPDTTPTVTPPTTHIDTTLTPTEIPIVSPIIQPFPDHTPTSPDYSPTSDREYDPSEDPSLDHITPLPSISPFLSWTDDSSDSDTHESPPSQDPYETVILPTPPGLPRRQAVLVLPGQPIPIDSSSSDFSSRHSSLGYAISDSSDDSSTATSARLSRKRCRSLLVPVSSPMRRALSLVHADLSPPPKRIRDSDSVTDLEVSLGESSESFIPRETSLRDDVVVKGSDEPYSEPDIDLEIQAEINECIAYADALRAKGIDARVVVKTSARGMEEVRVDRVTHLMVSNVIHEPTQEGAVEVTYETLGDLGHRIVVTGQQSADLLERISELERVNTKLRGMMDVARGLLGLRHVTMPNTRSGATMTREVINERKRKWRKRKRRSDENNNGNDNENGGGNGYNFGRFKLVARECTYQDFLKCQPLNFNGTEGVVGLTRWFEKMETVFHISNCPQKYQVKYATCILLNSALTWWNSYKRAIGIEAAYAMKWTELMKLMTEVYCPRNEIQKMEAELWKLTVKGNDLTTYIRRFQELVLLCTRMVLDEEDKVEIFIEGLPDNIQGNVIAAEPTRLQDAIRIANNLIDHKLKGYARSAEHKRRFDNNQRDNRRQQPAFKR